MRKVIFWAHLAAGLVAGSVILVMAVTGLMISFEKQLVALAERGTSTVAPVGERLKPGALIAKAREAVPDARPASITLRRDPTAPATVGVGRDRTVFLNPYTGSVLGEGTWLRPFLHQVEHFHRDLALGEKGKRITGAGALAFLGLVITGLYLWFPRRLVKAIFVPSLRLRGKARDFNWHNAIGFWAALPLLVMTLTGLVMNYQWANGLLFRATGNEPPPPRQARPAPNDAERPQPAPNFTHLDALWARAEASADDWQSISLRAQNPNAPATILIDRGDGTRPDKRATLSADLRTGEITKTEPFQSYNLGRQARMWIRPIHTGEAGGLLGQTIAALGAASAVVLIWTGFALSWRRFKNRQRKGEKKRNSRLPLSGASLPIAENQPAPLT